MQVERDPAAQREFAEAIRYDLRRSPDVASRMSADVDRAVQRIVQFPHAHPPLPGGLRRCLLSKFPYQIVYRVEGDVIRIYAVAHLKR